ncbi:MAG: hypothetical protein PHQ40_04830 [Anaerolineaceae bacterium]|nr:hypothetical protein [Anaerolineaceae bacterium]
MTRGFPLGPLSFFSLHNLRQGTYTAVGRAGKGKPVIGQMRYRSGSNSARMSFLLPVDALDSIVLPGLIEHLAYQAGAWGAPHIVAEVDEGSCVFEALRRAGFSVYGWQRVWKFPPVAKLGAVGAPDGSTPWKPMRGGGEIISVRSLYQSLVPSLVQPMETPPDRHSRGLVCLRNGDMMAYTELVYGPLGIWAQPFIHPAAEEAQLLLDGLVRGIPRGGQRPVYICVRSYQGWLESALHDLEGEVGPRQALMVKHLAIMQRVTQPLFASPLEKSRAKHIPAVNMDR